MNVFPSSDSPELQSTCPRHSTLVVGVARTQMGTHRVVFADLESDAIIESRIFACPDRAHRYAQHLLNQE